MSVVSTRAELRTSLTRKTDSDLTVTADLDYYLDLGELEVMSDWYTFDRGIFSQERQSIVTDSDGIGLLPETFMEEFAIETSDERRYFRIKIAHRRHNDGWYPVGYDIASGKRKIQIVEKGNNVGIKTIFFYDSERVLTAAADASKPIYPLEFRDLIAMKAAQLYYEDQGESYTRFSREKELIYNKKLAKAEERYSVTEEWPEYAATSDPDASGSDPLQRRSGQLT